MATYRVQEGEFDLPPGFRDATVNTLICKRSTGDVQIVVSRAPAEKKTLASLTDERLKEQQRRLPYFELQKNEGRIVAGLETRDVSVRYAEADRTILQRTASFVLGQALVVLVVSGPLGAEGDIDSIFETAVTTVNLREKRSE